MINKIIFKKQAFLVFTLINFLIIKKKKDSTIKMFDLIKHNIYEGLVSGTYNQRN